MAPALARCECFTLMKNSVGLGLPEYSFNTTHKVSIIGAGLAGCAIANALAQRGYCCAVYDQHSTVAAATSALPAAVVRPANNGDQFFSAYFDRAFKLCGESLPAHLFNQCGALEIADGSRVHSTELNNPNKLNADHASLIAGTKLTRDALHIEKAGVVVPGLLCQHLLINPPIVNRLVEFYPETKVDDLRKTDYGWQLIAGTEKVIDESSIVVLATGAAPRFSFASQIPLSRVAGQLDLFENEGAPLKCVVNGHRGYLAPEVSALAMNTAKLQGIWCGATHHRGNSNLAITSADSEANRKTAYALAPKLILGSAPRASYKGIRTYTPDRLPVVGAVHDDRQYRADYADLKHGKPSHHFNAPKFHKGLYMAAGLGSRGATQALLIARMIAELVSQGNADRNFVPDSEIARLQAPPASFYQELHPARFLLRAIRRGL